eukprot:c6564_g1_i1 orf=108-281(+)
MTIWQSGVRSAWYAGLVTMDSSPALSQVMMFFSSAVLRALYCNLQCPQRCVGQRLRN